MQGEMNKIFAEYSTSTAFFIQLSKTQCNALLALEEFKAGDDKGFQAAWAHTVTTMRTLEARGLVFWVRDGDYTIGFGGLTDAGQILVQLLKQAGLSVENTKSVSVVKREMNGRS